MIIEVIKMKTVVNFFIHDFGVIRVVPIFHKVTQLDEFTNFCNTEEGGLAIDQLSFIREKSGNLY